MTQIAYLVVGLVAGVVSGFLGIGGGAILVPAFVLLFGFTQHQAQGTALAVILPPVFILAVLKYYKEGHINVPMAILVALGLTLGAFVGAHFAQDVPAANLKKVFGIFLIIAGIKMAFFK